MSVGPEAVPCFPALFGSEGELVSVRVCVEPRSLEMLLEVLACLSFPVNPQIYHQAYVSHVHPNGREELVPVTLVEFPAFSGRVAEVREALRADGLAVAAVDIRSMLDELRSEADGDDGAFEGQRRGQVKIYRHLPVSRQAAEVLSAHERRRLHGKS